MKIKLNKRLQLTLIYFTPILILFSFFSIFVLINYSEEIYNIDEAISDKIFENKIDFKESKKNVNNLDGEHTNSKFINIKEEPILNPDNYSKENTLNINNNDILKNNIIVDSINNPNVYNSHISFEEISTIQDDSYSSLLKNIFPVLFVTTIIFAWLAYYFSGKALHPLEKALRKQKTFISDSSHEIKTPLALIKTEAEVLLRNSNSNLEEFKSFAFNVIEDVNRLNGLSDSLLTLAELDESTSTNKQIKENINLFHITKKLIKKLNLKIKKQNIKIENKINKEINLNINENKLSQVINIILDNAIKYSKKSSLIKIDAFSHNNFINILIKNTGQTIPKEDLKNIYDRFYRVSKDRNKAGYGLGLAIAKEIMIEQKGKIDIKSKNSETVVTLSFKL